MLSGGRATGSSVLRPEVTTQLFGLRYLFHGDGFTMPVSVFSDTLNVSCPRFPGILQGGNSLPC